MKNIIKFFFTKYKVLVPIFIIIILFFISYLIYLNINNKVIAYDDNKDIIKENIKEVSENIEVNKIKIDIKGMVVNPGVYELDESSRVIDAIIVAGGLLENADTCNINLSKILKDQNVIIIESKKEDIEPQKIIEYVYKECECPKFNDACIKSNEIVNFQEDNVNTKEETINNESNNKDDSNIKVSLNTGTLQELQTLSGVGESKAKAIIKYREENGPFSTLQDIMNVSGIGDALFEKIKDSITL